jgi:hypothetical protein
MDHRAGLYCATLRTWLLQYVCAGHHSSLFVSPPHASDADGSVSGRADSAIFWLHIYDRVHQTQATRAARFHTAATGIVQMNCTNQNSRLVRRGKPPADGRGGSGSLLDGAATDVPSAAKAAKAAVHIRDACLELVSTEQMCVSTHRRFSSSA